MEVAQDLPLISSSPDRARILHLTDLHFEASPDAAFRSSMQSSVRRVREKWCAEGGIDLVCVTGDIVDNASLNGRPEERQKILTDARDYLDTLCHEVTSGASGRLVIVPGNHDYRWFGNRSSEIFETEFAEVFGPYLADREFIFANLGLCLEVFCFDSNHLHCTRKFDFARGYVKPEALHRLPSGRSQTGANGHTVRIGLVHHHPLPVATSEVQEPRTFWDRVFGKVVDGAPEYMLLRNSGTFLRVLLERDFRMVLHGHLHEAGYWKVLGTVNSGKPKWLEVVSGPSVAPSNRSGRRHFGVIDVFPDGYIAGNHFAFDDNGEEPVAIAIPFAPYEEYRTFRRNVPETFLLEGKMRRMVQTWEVDLATGNLKLEERFERFGPTDRSMDEYVAAEASGGITHTEFNARSESTPHRIRPDVLENPENSGVSGSVVCKVLVEPRMEPGETLDITHTYALRGVMSLDLEDDLLSNPKTAGTSGTDAITQTIGRSIEQLQMRVRFVPDPRTNWLPESVTHRVTDVLDEDSLRNREANCGQVMFHPYPVSHSRGQRGCAEAVLTVFNPVLGYKYSIKWDLRKSRATEKRASLSRARKAVLDGANKNSTSFGLIKKFVRDALDGSKMECLGPDIMGFVFAFDESRRELVCMCNSVGGDDPACLRSVGYGRNVMGTSFRLNIPVFFSPHSEGFELLDAELRGKFPFLVGFPLGSDGEENDALGVFALASESPNSAIANLADETSRKKVHEVVSRLWKQTGFAPLETESRQTSPA